LLGIDGVAFHWSFNFNWVGLGGGGKCRPIAPAFEKDKINFLESPIILHDANFALTSTQLQHSLPADVMERSELLSSAASGSYEVAQTESDDSRSEGCSEETLNAVEGAILRTLRQHSLHPADRHSDESKRLRGRLNNARDEEQQSESTPPATKSSNPEDMELLATLLKRVHWLPFLEFYACVAAS
jgi:hypothetical protein